MRRKNLTARPQPCVASVFLCKVGPWPFRGNCSGIRLTTRENHENSHSPETYHPNNCGSDACRGSNSLWTRTLDRYTRAGLPECVVSTMSGPPPETTQDKTKTKDTHNPRIGIKIPDSAVNLTRAAGLEGRDSTDHATATDCN